MRNIMNKQIAVDYKERIEYLEKELNISKSEIFDFSDTAGENEFISHYKFCQDALLLHKDFGIEPYLIYYKDLSDIDAKARKTKKHYLIIINKGIIEFFNRNLVSYFDLHDYDEVNKYLELENKLTNPIGELMYQSIMHFTFYHELGHLIQFSGKENGELNESLNDGHKYSIDLHCEELDADLFASISLSTHLYQYFERYFIGKPKANDVINYISILSSSVFIYFLSFAEYRNGFYLREKSHPHPLLRILSATARIVDYFQHVLKKKGIELEINQQLVFQETFRISEIFINKFFAEKEFQGFLSLMKENLKDIETYYNEMIPIIQGNPSSAINRRNKNLKNE